MPKLDIVIVNRMGDLKALSVKEFKVEELYKKCGFKSAEGFAKQTEWTVKFDGKKMLVQVYAKTNGKANTENKYDFPPPIDTKLFFGNCAIVGQSKEDSNVFVNLSVGVWERVYEKLFGGFETLAATAKADENEIDELQHVPKSKKTKKGGYLKDGFVVDSSDDNDEEDDKEDDDDDDDEDEDEDTEEDTGDDDEDDTEEIEDTADEEEDNHGQNDGIGHSHSHSHNHSHSHSHSHNHNGNVIGDTERERQRERERDGRHTATREEENTDTSSELTEESYLE